MTPAPAVSALAFRHQSFRYGMVHEYAVKRTCTIFMVKGTEMCGVGIDLEGRFHFVVETYFEDFKRAARELVRELQRKPALPK